MTERIEFAIKIESANRRISPNRLRDRFYMSGKYRSCKQSLTLFFKTAFKLRNIGDCNIEIGFSKNQWSGDLDNGSKIVLDALQCAGVIRNDRDVKRLVLQRLCLGVEKSYIEIGALFTKKTKSVVK